MFAAILFHKVMQERVIPTVWHKMFISFQATWLSMHRCTPLTKHHNDWHLRIILKIYKYNFETLDRQMPMFQIMFLNFEIKYISKCAILSINIY